MTSDQAQLIIEAHSINEILDNEEEVELLEKQGPDILRAYKALKRIADGKSLVITNCSTPKDA